MFYLILALMLVLFYIFAAPRSVKGTMNLVASVFLLVALVIAIVLGFLKVVESPPELWMGVIMSLLGIWTMYDIAKMEKKGKRS